MCDSFPREGEEGVSTPGKFIPYAPTRLVQRISWVAWLKLPGLVISAESPRQQRAFYPCVIARRNDVAIPDRQGVSVSRGLPHCVRKDVIVE